MTGELDHVDLTKLENGQSVKGTYVVRERELKRKKNGEPWLRLVLADATGTTEAVRWDDADELYAVCEVGVVVFVLGAYEVSERWGSKIKLSSIRRAEKGEYDPERLMPSSPIDVVELELRLTALLEAAIGEKGPLADLMVHFFGQESEIWERFREAPAAKSNHHAYRFGLLEHSLMVGQVVYQAATIFPGVDREVAVAGALLHDIGKLWAYTDDPLAIDYTDAGKLEGEIPIGYFVVRSAIESIEGFDPDVARSLLHIILSHHGRYEYGSPVEPQTREAVLVHFVDNLGGRLGSFDRVERGLPEGERWSGWDRALSGPVYFPPERQSGDDAPES